MSIERRVRKRDGRTIYEVRLRDPKGHEYSRTFATRREAETFAAREAADRSRGAWIDPRRSSTTFAELAAQWLTDNATKRHTTRVRDEGIVRIHLEPRIGDRKIVAVTPATVQALVSEWMATDPPGTVRRKYAVLQAVFNYAVNNDLLVRTPCRRIKLPAIEHQDRHIVTDDELARLAGGVGDDYRAMVYVGAVLGLRWGECAGLRVGRLDFLRNTLTVAEQFTCGQLGTPKSRAGRRTMSVYGDLMNELSAHLQRRGLTGANVDELVFVGPTGRPIDYSNWRRKVWVPATRRVGLDGLTFHDLRRGNATGLVGENVDVKTAQKRLGHADPRTTLGIYAQSTSTADRAAAERVGRRFMTSRDASEQRDTNSDRGMNAG